MRPSNAKTESSARAFAEILLVFLKLGCTSFGGPVAHLGYFHRELVERRRWVDEHDFAELLAMCQTLPGPASSQVGFSLGLLRGGVLGGLAAWLGFTLPSSALMLLFATGHALFSGSRGRGALHGLSLVAMAVVAEAVWTLSRRLTPDLLRVCMALGVAGAVLLFPDPRVQPLVLAVAAACGLLLKARLGSAVMPVGRAPQVEVSRRASVVAFAVIAGMLLVTAGAEWPAAVMASAFFRTGALVFGGGHVVLPLLYQRTVVRGWTDTATFFSGYGAAQALPGPLFTFGAYLGAVVRVGPGGIAGGLIALVAIFLPGLLVVLGVLPWWTRLRRSACGMAGLAGVNAGVVGLLGAALYRPIALQAVHGVWDLALVGVALALLLLKRVSVGWVVLSLAVGGWIVGA